MAKKKPTLNLSSKNILFSIGEDKFKIISFNEEKMRVKCIALLDDGTKEDKEFAFAQLPKEIKKLLRNQN